MFFQDTYQIPLSQITLLLTVGFIVQLTTDIVWAKIADRMGYRISMVIAYFAAAGGLLALAGDIGCSAGPTLVGMVSDAANDNMKIGILVGMIFPITMLICMLFWKLKQKKAKG